MRMTRGMKIKTFGWYSIADCLGGNWESMYVTVLYKCIKDIFSQNTETLFKQKNQISTEQINRYFKMEISRKTCLIVDEILEQPHKRGSFSSLNVMSLWEEVYSMTVWSCRIKDPRLLFLFQFIHRVSSLSHTSQRRGDKKDLQMDRNLKPPVQFYSTLIPVLARWTAMAKWPRSWPLQ